MLSGDKERHAKAIADELGLDGYHAELLPDQKQEHLAEIERTNPHLAYVGGMG